MGLLSFFKRSKNQPSIYNISRKGAQRTGALQTWLPKWLLSKEQYAWEREEIVKRSTDITQSDADAQSVKVTIPNTVIGSGLLPYPQLDYERLGITKEQAKIISRRMRNVWDEWTEYADAQEVNHFGQLENLALQQEIQKGESIFLVHMINDEKKYSLRTRLIDSNRLKTPIDLTNDKNICDGIRLGKYGKPVSYFIENPDSLTESSNDFTEIKRKSGHRFNVIHTARQEDPEQLRGFPLLSSAIKKFRDLSDLTNSELESAIVTAAMAVFVEVPEGIDPLFPAQAAATETITDYKSDGNSYDVRYEKIESGRVMYGAAGQRPHLLHANRPGITFEPFVKRILLSIANSTGIPYPVLFKDFEGMNYASYRSAMLEAWRVYKIMRTNAGRAKNSIFFRMLIEESWLMGEFPEITDFYENMHAWTKCLWIGPAKGQIEPIKEAQADILEIQNNLKSRTEAALERGRDIYSTFDQLSDEQEGMKERELTEEKVTGQDFSDNQDVSNQENMDNNNE